LHHGVHVIASHMGRKQTPATLPTHLLNRFQYGSATDLIEVIGSLIHMFTIGCGARWIRFQERSSTHIVRAVDGARFAAVQVASVAGKGNQVSHWL